MLDSAEVSIKAGELLRDYRSSTRAVWKPMPHQVAPDGAWYGWLLMAGRGAGKTDAAAKYVVDHVRGPPCLPGPIPHWIGIIAPTLNDAAEACFNGPSGIAAHDATAVLKGGVGGHHVHWPNGSQAKLFGASTPEDVERLRAGGNRCIVLNTIVQTARGPRRVDEIQAGDEVWTRAGLRKVLVAGVSQPSAEIWRLETTAGSLEATPDHEVLTQRGWVQMQFLTPDDTLSAWQSTSSSSMTGCAGESDQTGTGLTRDEGCCIATSGSDTTDRSHRGCTSTTATTTGRGTTSSTSNSSRPPSIHGVIPVVTSRRRTRRRGGRRGRIESFATSTANAAARRSERALPGEVVTTVASATTRGTSPAKFPVAHERDGCALCAATTSRPPSGERPELAPARVLRCSPAGRTEPVYDLAVEHDHEFFANGLLVANCLAWLEELAAWRYLDDCWNHMRFGLRAGRRPHWVGSTTPKPRKLIRELAKGKVGKVVTTHATTYDNPHLPEEIRNALEEAYDGSTLGAQELRGLIIDQDENALWTRELLDEHRVDEAPESLVKISVGVDPSGGAGEQGIVVVGKERLIVPGGQKVAFHGYVLADASCHLPPAGWGRRAVQAAVDYDADDIVVETNFGGDMAMATVQGAADDLGISIPVRKVTASRGKKVRAEPVAALSNRGKWHHVGRFEQLEEQQCTWTEDAGYSPDRLDAMVWPAWHQKLVSLTAVSGRGAFGGSALARTRLA